MSAPRSPYYGRIAALCGTTDPRHVEAYMRIEHGTLDHLSPAQFARDVAIAVACVVAEGTDDAEALAESYGL